MTTNSTPRAPLAVPVNMILGTAASENISGKPGDDFIYGDAGDDRLSGGGGDDVLYGEADNDTLIGGAGTDTLIGGLGDDTYVWDGVDILVENAGEGTDTVQTALGYQLEANFENLILTGSADVDGYGNNVANVITGNSGANLLIGGAGNDVLSGGAGKDSLFGGADNDTLFGGNDDDVLNGGAGVDVLDGGNGHDQLDGGTGADTMSGGAGNDSYYVDNAGDKVIELLNHGTDTVYTALHSYTLTANVENLIGTSSDKQLLTGNALRNVITTGSGDDVINGGDGNDTLTGGTGNDRLTGGAGADVFIFTNAEISLSGQPGQIKQVDTIFDFDFTAGDRVDLRAIDANSIEGGNQAFSLVSTFTGQAGEARLVYVASTNNTALQLDVDGDGLSDYQLNLRGGDFTAAPVVTDADPVHMGGWIL